MSILSGRRLVAAFGAVAIVAGSITATSSAALAAPDTQPSGSKSCVAQQKHGGTRLPLTIDGGEWPAGHVQGIAVDRKHGFVYYSFTTILVKTDLAGTVLGSVVGFTGHLGDLDFNEKDGRVYGSLEYKEAESFYIAIFDVDKITALDMDAETSGIVTTVYLEEVVEDFTADMDANGVFDGDIANTPDHRYGSSGIDGVSFGPPFGRDHGRDVLMVAYGVYSNVDRTDNDNQVILQYDVKRWKKYEQPLTQTAPHTSGPADEDAKYFVYTGNTTFGVQNLEYDDYTGNWLLAARSRSSRTTRSSPSTAPTGHGRASCRVRRRRRPAASCSCSTRACLTRRPASAVSPSSRTSASSRWAAATSTWPHRASGWKAT
jgi:hypothetical protein